jgi:hypothetical protein
MTGESEDDLPLHDEAKARPKWRGDESLPDGGGRGSSGPASETDDSATDDRQSEVGLEGIVLRDLARRPPD